MPQPKPVALSREWFADDRSPARRMQVSHHRERGLVVISLWQGGSCTATFRLPLADAGRLAHVLVEALERAALSGPALTAASEAPTRWLETIRRRLRPRLGEVPSLFGPDRRRRR